MRILVTLALCLQLLAPLSAWAQSRDPLSYPLKHYAFVLSMTLLGGFVGWYVKVRKGEVPAHSLFALIGEMATSSLAGLGAFLICDWLNAPLGITGAVAGLCGYMGGRAIEIGEKWLAQRTSQQTPLPTLPKE